MPVPQRNDNRKVVGEFYPLQKSELMALRKAKLINNAAYVHLALRYENPFCDRPIEIVPKEFALQWFIPESSVYEALGKLRKLEIINIKTGKILIQWASSQQVEIIDCQQVEDSENPESVTESQDRLQDFITDSKASENRGSKPLPSDDSGPIQTIQTLQTNQTAAVVEKSENDLEQPTLSKPVIEQSTSSVTPLCDSLISPPNLRQGKNPAPRCENDFHIPSDLKVKLEELGIPLDGRVSKVIASHDLSQAYGAAAHVERTWETIDNPRGVFLFQIGRQPVEPLGSRLPVRTAADWGYTLEDLKKMYPGTWQEAARHFGLEVFA